MHGVELAVAPVAEVKGLLVLRREFGPVAEGNARGRAGADVDHRRQAVDVVRRPLARAVAVAEIAAAGDVEHAGGAIPRHVHVPLHVGVVREQLAVAVEGDVERVAIAHRHQLPVLAVGLTRQMWPPGAFSSVMKPAPSTMRGSRLSSPQMRGTSEPSSAGQPRGIAGDDVERLAVGCQDHRVRAVLAAAVELAQELDLVEPVVAVGVADAIEPAVILPAAIDDHVEAVERPEQAVGLADRHVDRLDVDRSGLRCRSAAA